MAPWIFPFSKGQARGAAGDLVVLAIPWETRDSKQQLQGTPNTRKTWKNVLQLKLWWWRGGEIPFPDVHHRGKILLFSFNWKAENE